MVSGPYQDLKMGYFGQLPNILMWHKAVEKINSSTPRKISHLENMPNYFQALCSGQVFLVCRRNEIVDKCQTSLNW
jgi:hypothetical protein